jgi:uncharacterized coiled-coil protein SlyX
MSYYKEQSIKNKIAWARMDLDETEDDVEKLQRLVKALTGRLKQLERRLEAHERMPTHRTKGQR